MTDKVHPFFSEKMTKYVDRYVKSQQVLGARWPESEYLLTRRIGRDGETVYRLQLFKPSDSLYPWFERPFASRKAKGLRARCTGWIVRPICK